MTTLYLHIGMHKTGSTSIQNVLTRNATSLLDCGIFSPERLVPKANGARFKRHHDLVRAIADPRHDRSHGGIAEQYHRTVSHAPQDNVVLTSEEFCDLDAAQITRLRTALPDMPTRVVVYVRNQVDWIESIINQRVKSGGLHEIHAGYAMLVDRLDYHAMVEAWAGAFGRENILVRIYDHVGNVVEDFFAILGIKDTASLVTMDARANDKLSAPAFELKRLANAAVGHDKDVRRIVEQLQRSEGWTDKARLLSPEQVDDVIARTRESNAKLWADYLPAGTPAFPMVRRPTPNPPALSVETLTLALSATWAAQRRREEARKEADKADPARRKRRFRWLPNR